MSSAYPNTCVLLSRRLPGLLVPICCVKMSAGGGKGPRKAPGCPPVRRWVGSRPWPGWAQVQVLRQVPWAGQAMAARAGATAHGEAER